MIDRWLIFIDTNVFLDFYRQSGASAEKQLVELEKHSYRLILTEQVHMEFLKHRQGEIIRLAQRLRGTTAPDVPQILGDLPATFGLNEAREKEKASQKALQENIRQMLLSPAEYDPVYKGLERLFNIDSPYYMNDHTLQAEKIYTLAETRFRLGRPPRKASDNSIGDAINWEWIVRCAGEGEESYNVMIVTRDSDYGKKYGSVYYVNDCLRAEYTFRTRSTKRIEITPSLFDALAKFEVKIQDEDHQEEAQFLHDQREAEIIVSEFEEKNQYTEEELLRVLALLS